MNIGTVILVAQSVHCLRTNMLEDPTPLSLMLWSMPCQTCSRHCFSYLFCALQLIRLAVGWHSSSRNRVDWSRAIQRQQICVPNCTNIL